MRSMAARGHKQGNFVPHLLEACRRCTATLVSRFHALGLHLSLLGAAVGCFPACCCRGWACVSGNGPPDIDKASCSEAIRGHSFALSTRIPMQPPRLAQHGFVRRLQQRNVASRSHGCAQIGGALRFIASLAAMGSAKSNSRRRADVDSSVSVMISEGYNG